MLYYGRKGRLVNQPPLTEHKQTHDLLMHYENCPAELPPLPPLDAPWEEKVRTHTSFQGGSPSFLPSLDARPRRANVQLLPQAALHG